MNPHRGVKQSTNTDEPPPFGCKGVRQMLTVGIQASATSHPLPDDSAQAFITDPPYYNAVPYADLSCDLCEFAAQPPVGFQRSREGGQSPLEDT